MRVRWSTTLIAGSMVTALTLGGAALATQTASSTSAPEVSRSAATPPAPAAATAASAFGDMPLAFVANQGQTDPRVRYYAVGRPLRLLRHARRADALADQGKPAATSPSRCASSTAAPTKVTADSRAPGAVNYLVRPTAGAGRRGSRSTATGLPRPLARIDLRLREQAGVLKYEFHVRPGASPSDIRLAYGGPTARASTTTARCRSRPPLGVLRDSRAGVLPGRSTAPACRWRAATCSASAAPATRASRSPSAATSATTSW